MDKEKSIYMTERKEYYDFPQEEKGFTAKICKNAKQAKNSKICKICTKTAKYEKICICMTFTALLIT